MPDESVGGGKVGLFVARRRKALKRCGDPLQELVVVGTRCANLRPAAGAFRRRFTAFWSRRFSHAEFG
jgi:hypothetical protein